MSWSDPGATIDLDPVTLNINKISEICRVSPAYNAENATVSQDVQPVW